jgi:hypothetical protein
MHIETYKDNQNIRHFDLMLPGGLGSIDLVSLLFSAILMSGAICALLSTVHSSASTLSRWVH